MWNHLRDGLILLIGLALVIVLTMARDSLTDLNGDIKQLTGETFQNRVTGCRILLSEGQPLIPGGPCSEWAVARLLILAPVNVTASESDIVKVLGTKELCETLLQVKAPIEKECRVRRG